VCVVIVLLNHCNVLALLSFVVVWWFVNFVAIHHMQVDFRLLHIV